MSDSSSQDFEISHTSASLDYDSSEDNSVGSDNSGLFAPATSHSSSLSAGRAASSRRSTPSLADSGGAASLAATDRSDSSATEEYDLPGEAMIDLSDTQYLTQELVDVEQEDDDVMLIPQHIETIDLCTENFDIPRPRPPLFTNEVIEIQDSPAGAIRTTRVTRSNFGQRTSPYQTHAATVPGKEKPIAARNLNLNDSGDMDTDEPSQRVKITCPICLDSSMKKKLVSTKCGHIYCEDCLKLALQTLKKCPVCRKALTGKDPFHPIYFNGHM